jgi:hypothetical protein
MPDPYVAATFNLFVKGLPRGDNGRLDLSIA